MRELTPADRRRLDDAGISAAELERQLALLADPPAAVRLARPATVGDGVVHLDEARHESLLSRADGAVAEGRVLRFVPASGAATRMFKPLIAAWHGSGAPEDRHAVSRLLEELDRLPFRDPLVAAIGAEEVEAARESGDVGAVLGALLGPEGLGYADLPKGLVLFHRGNDGASARTAFEEHLVEAASYLTDASGVCRLHLTVPEGRMADFENAWKALREGVEATTGATFDLGFSEQEASTHTVATTPEGELFHDDDGLLLRPGGHGALLSNLDRLGADLVTIKNVDNVQPERGHVLIGRWKRLLLGHLLELADGVDDLLSRLAAEDERSPDPGLVAEAAAFLAVPLGRPRVDAELGALRHALDRPLRVCGVVVNQGEPGGGPFWVEDARRGLSLQIVETSQIDREEPDQEAVLRASTHFNPVDVVCRLRDRHGRPYSLREPHLVDERTSFVAWKDHRGHRLRALERPGLWNGSMAGWNTVFVEVPAATFSPVKTVFDLLRPRHQPV